MNKPKAFLTLIAICSVVGAAVAATIIKLNTHTIYTNSAVGLPGIFTVTGKIIPRHGTITFATIIYRAPVVQTHWHISD